jgi:hypothetical protein
MPIFDGPWFSCGWNCCCCPPICWNGIGPPQFCCRWNWAWPPKPCWAWGLGAGAPWRNEMGGPPCLMLNGYFLKLKFNYTDHGIRILAYSFFGNLPENFGQSNSLPIYGHSYWKNKIKNIKTMYLLVKYPYSSIIAINPLDENTYFSPTISIHRYRFTARLGEAPQEEVR